jgi:hypothetical protein
MNEVSVKVRVEQTVSLFGDESSLVQSLRLVLECVFGCRPCLLVKFSTSNTVELSQEYKTLTGAESC